MQLGDDEVLLPGLVDTHVHVNEPGRTEWEGFATATRAAAAGGVTTIIDMPLNSIPPTIDVDALEAKRDAARGQCHVDVGFWGGAVPGSLGRLRPLHDAGVFGFKCFLLPSGVDEFPALDEQGMRAAMAEVAGFDGLLIVHAEDAAVIGSAPEPRGRSYASFLASRPPAAEETRHRAGRRRRPRHRRAGPRPAPRGRRRAGAAADGAAATVRGSAWRPARTTSRSPPRRSPTAPPCSSAARRSAGRTTGSGSGARCAAATIDCVVSDHSPSTPALKLLDSGDFGAAWGGISSLQLGLPAVWTGARQRGAGLADVVGWMAERPAALARLARKGRIATGCDADLVAFAPDETFLVDAAGLHHRHALTPYAGRRLSGIVRQSWLRGRETGAEPTGRLLTRGDA